MEETDDEEEEEEEEDAEEARRKRRGSVVAPCGVEAPWPYRTTGLIKCEASSKCVGSGSYGGVEVRAAADADAVRDDPRGELPAARAAARRPAAARDQGAGAGPELGGHGTHVARDFFISGGGRASAE